jgi:hypothetical protein
MSFERSESNASLVISPGEPLICSIWLVLRFWASEMQGAEKSGSLLLFGLVPQPMGEPCAVGECEGRGGEDDGCADSPAANKVAGELAAVRLIDGRPEDDAESDAASGSGGQGGEESDSFRCLSLSCDVEADLHCFREEAGGSDCCEK